MNIDINLLRRQTLFLLEYPWREGVMPVEVEGVVSLLETILDKEEGYVSVSG
jgi:hypothetical protein